MTTIPIRLIAPAKLTTRLKLVGVRADGYHLIDAEMVSLTLADTLDVTTLDVTALNDAAMTDSSSMTVSGPFGGGIPTDATNLVLRALSLVQRHAHVAVDKQIPAGGGLGGGSADAAAILRWAGYSDVAGSASLGADVPFCLLGGRARVTGIGELLEPLPHEERTFTLCIPPIHVSTPAAYRAWDALGGPSLDGPNDLEAGAIAVAPQLAVWRDRFGDATGQQPVLAGSGATWFCEGSFGDVATRLPGAHVIVTRASGETSSQ
jgi:4-diphosphocytidyl-2-C-methyl-D-erythritol kinase